MQVVDEVKEMPTLLIFIPLSQRSQSRRRRPDGDLERLPVLCSIPPQRLPPPVCTEQRVMSVVVVMKVVMVVVVVVVVVVIIWEALTSVSGRVTERSTFIGSVLLSQQSVFAPSKPFMQFLAHSF
ncbi:hypothetical protein E2C01_066622 [Portunus trituberculatus]|uniref:Uncharacterized protein n=1 Tax=Portunus trituberculatus TaxID=210409 RepID=A0A5B7HHL6_PORTR|nr:hypothetical protein [Portunus trituberculatus]